MGKFQHTPSSNTEQQQHPPGTVDLFSGCQNDTKKIVVGMPRPSDNPNDPLGWQMWRKCLNFGLLAAMTLSIFTGLSIQHLFWAPMRKEIHLKTEQLIQAKAMLHGAEAVSCCLMIPFATKYGRRSVYLVSTIVFTAAVWWTAYLKTVPELFIANVLKGVAGAVNETAIQMSICDMFFIHQRGTANSIYFITLKFGHFLTPLAAGAQATIYGWRSSYQTLAAVMTVLTFVFFIAFEETKFVRSSGDSDSLELECKDSASITKHSFQELTVPHVSFPSYFRLQLVTPTNESLWKLFYQPLFSLAIPQVLFTALVVGIGLGLIGITGSMKSIIFTEPPYNFNPRELGLLHVGPLVGSVFGCLYGGYLNDRMVMWLARRNKGLFEPEMRLYFLPLPAIAIAAGLVTFGITADLKMHWIYPTIGSGLSAFGVSATASILFTLVIDSYPNIVAQAFVVIALFRNSIGSIGNFALTPWRESMTIKWMFILAAILSLFVQSMAIPLAIVGKRVRAATASRYTKLSREYSQKT